MNDFLTESEASEQIFTFKFTLTSFIMSVTVITTITGTVTRVATARKMY